MAEELQWLLSGGVGVWGWEGIKSTTLSPLQGFPLWIAQSFVKIDCDCYTRAYFSLLYSTCGPTCFFTDTQILSCFVWICQWRGFS